MKRLLAATSLFLASLNAAAQAHDGMAMTKPAAQPSTSLTILQLDGSTSTYSPEQFKSLPHVTVHVHNAHNNQDETYSGVPVDTLIKQPAASSSGAPRVSTNMQVVVAGATDNFHVVITMCDVMPQCRSGQAIVADALDAKPLASDGAFKLVLTEDKKPARWARNLSSLTVKALN